MPLLTRARLTSILVALGATGLSLLAAELAVRLVQPQPLLQFSPGLYQLDPPGRYRLVPGYRGEVTNRAEFTHEATVNSLALRGPEPSPTAGGPRVLAIGDSFTFGVGVGDEETFVARLPAELARHGSGAVGLNAGLPGTGIPDVVGWLERHGLALEPDLVVVAVFLGNDLADAAPGREEIELKEGLIAPKGSPGGLRSWLYHRSHLFLLAKNTLSSPALLGLRRFVGLGEPWRLRTLRSELAIYAVPPPPAMASAADETARALARLADLGRARGFRTAALLIPGELQVEPERWRSTLAYLGLDAERYDLREPNRIFERLLGEAGIPALDLTAAITAAKDRGQTLYYRHDRHWTREGHQVAARALADFLAAEGLLAGGDEPAGEPDGPSPPS